MATGTAAIVLPLGPCLRCGLPVFVHQEGDLSDRNDPEGMIHRRCQDEFFEACEAEGTD
jgi:hypothetical protein